MGEAQKVFLAERKVKKILLTLPEDQIKMIDECAKAVGLSRSSFLHIYFDVFAERVRDFTEGLLVGVGPYQQKKLEKMKRER